MNENTKIDTTTRPDHDGSPSGRSQSGLAMSWVLAALLVLACGGGLWWWKTHAAGAVEGVAAPGASAPGGGSGGRRFGGANPAQPVSVQAVRRQDIRVIVNAIGSIAALNTAIVHVQVSGVLQRLDFKEGQQVKAGQLLAQLDPRALQATLGQAEGALARDKAQLDGARVDLVRYRDLLAKDGIAKQQFDSQVALVAQLEGTVKLDQAAMESARLQLSYTRVTAPIAGRVGLKQLDLGNVAQPSDPNGVVIITQTRPIAMVFAVPSAQLPLITARLRAHQALPVEARDRTGTTRLAVGSVATTDNAIDPTTDTIKVKALFANDDDALFPNQAVSVSLQLDTLTDVLAVPQAAVLRGAQGFYVYVVNPDNSVSTRVVKPGAVDGNWMAVEGPLQPGENVVIDGVDRLRDGATVEVIAADPSKRAGAAAPSGRAARGAAGAASAGLNDAALAAANGSSAPPTAEAGSNAGERPRWMDRVPPEVAEKLMKLSPDERRAWFLKRREEADRAGTVGKPAESSK